MTKKKIGVLALALIVVGGGIYFWRSRSRSEVTYAELNVEKGDLDISIVATGTVQPQNRLEIKPPIAGRIEDVLVQEGQKVKKGQVLAWMSSSERAALLDAARAKGLDEYNKWQELYRATPIMAPINGTLILRAVEPGQSFTSTDPILVMSDRLTVKAQVDETDIAQIKLKDHAEIILDAYPKERIPAIVDQIAYEAKTVNNVTTYVVDVLPIKTPDFMRSGMTSNVTFAIESKSDILLVPSEALKVSKHRTTVLVRSDKGKPVEKEIQVGLTNGKLTEVKEGLSEGDVVLMAQMQLGDTSKGSSPFNPFAGRKKPTSRKF